MSGWLVLALGAPTKTLALRKGLERNYSLGIVNVSAGDAVSGAACPRRLGSGSRAETCLGWRPTVKPDFLAETYGRLKPGLEEVANSPNSSLGGAMYIVS